MVSGWGWAGRSGHRSRSYGFGFERGVASASAAVVGVVFFPCSQDRLPSIAEGEDVRANSLVSVEQRRHVKVNSCLVPSNLNGSYQATISKLKDED